MVLVSPVSDNCVSRMYDTAVSWLCYHTILASQLWWCIDIGNIMPNKTNILRLRLQPRASIHVCNDFLQWQSSWNKEFIQLSFMWKLAEVNGWDTLLLADRDTAAILVSVKGDRMNCNALLLTKRASLWKPHFKQVKLVQTECSYVANYTVSSDLCLVNREFWNIFLWEILCYPEKKICLAHSSKATVTD